VSDAIQSSMVGLGQVVHVSRKEPTVWSLLMSPVNTKNFNYSTLILYLHNNTLDNTEIFIPHTIILSLKLLNVFLTA